MTFVMDERLAGDTVGVCQLDLCHVGLLKDARYPWLVLVPERAGLTEVTDLAEADRAMLWREVEQCCGVLQKLYPNWKLNIGALGNIVRQLHIHVIARHEEDEAWPGPVWGVGKAVAYQDQELSDMLERLKRAF